jgi:hypothetical protein
MGSYFVPRSNYFFQDVNALGNVTANIFIGNGALLTGVTGVTLPNIANIDIIGNVTGVYANVDTVNANGIAANGDIIALGNAVASLFIGNGALLTGVTASSTLPDVVIRDIRGNIIGAYANVSNIIAVQGNIGNTRFLGGNVAVSGQVNVLGNVVGNFFIGNGSQLTGIAANALPGVITADIRGNIIGVYANVSNIIAVQGNIGNTRFLGGNVAVSGQVNVLGNVVGNFFVGNGSQLTGIAAALPGVISEDIIGNIIGVYANVSNIIAVQGNVGNTRFLGGNVAVSGQVNVTGNVIGQHFFGNSVTASALRVDDTFYLQLQSNNSILAFDSNDYFEYVRSSNRLDLNMSGNSVARFDSQGNLNVLGNVIAPFFVGNGSQLTGITASALPGVITADIRGNIIGAYANVSNVIAVEGNIGNTRFLGGNVAVSGQVNVLGNVVGNFFVGNGSQLTGIAAALPGVITADIRGNVIGAYANVTTVIGTTGNIGNVRMDTGVVTAPRHTIDDNYYLALSGTNPIVNLDAFDYLGYNRTANSLFLVVGGNTKATIDGEGNLLLTGNVNAVDGNFSGNIRSIIGNVGNTRFLGGNVAVSGQVNVLGNVVGNFFIGNGSQLTGIAAALPGVIAKDIVGNIIGAYANVSNIIAVQGNVGNTQFLGGNVAVSGQINTLGNIVAPFFIGNGSQLTGIAANALPGVITADIRGNIIGSYANVANIIAVQGNVGNTRFLGGNVTVSGQINVLGDITGGNTATITCSTDSNAFTVNVPIASGYLSTMIYGTTARGSTGNYSFMRLDNSAGRVLNIDGTGALTVTTQQSVSNGLTLNCSSSGYASAVIQANVNRGAVNGYSFLRFDNTFGRVLDIAGTGAIIATTPVNDNVLTINSTIGSYSNTLVYLSSQRGLTNAYSFLRCDAGNGGVRVFELDGRGAITSNCGQDTNVLDVSATISGFTSNVLTMRTNKAQNADFNFINCTAGTGATTPFRVNGKGDVTTTGNIAVVDGKFSLEVSGGDPYIYLDTNDNLSYYRAENTLIYSTNNIARLTVDETGNISTTGNIRVRDGVFTGNVVVAKDIRGANIMTLTCASNANVLTVSGTTLDNGGTSLIQATTLRGNNTSYSLLRLDNIGGRILDVDGSGSIFVTSPSTSDIMTITGRTSALVGNAMGITIPKGSLIDYNFITCRNSNGILFNVDGRGMATATSFVNSNILILNANQPNYTTDVLRMQTASNTNLYNMIIARNGAGAVFRVNGNGAVYGTGAFQTTGADYAEMFEWEDGNKLDEDRRGMTVVLGNNGIIRIANQMDNPVDVIGVVSVNPSVIGDTKWNEWNGRFLKDKFGVKLSNTLYYISNVSNENERVRCGINDNPPGGYEKITSSEHILNPKYNPADIYVPREDRLEWSPIGLMGKLRVLPDQIVNPGWKLLRTIKHPDGDTLEYLVK